MLYDLERLEEKEVKMPQRLEILKIRRGKNSAKKQDLRQK